MSAGFPESERREFVRVKTILPIKYKFIGMTAEPAPDTVFDGSTKNISSGGLLLVGLIPEPRLITELLTQKTVIGVNVFFPLEDEPVKALTRVVWLEAPPDQGESTYMMGLCFKEITKEHQDRVLRFIIKSEIAK